MGLPRRIAERLPGLRQQLRIAHLPDTPEHWVFKAMIVSLYFAFAFGVGAFLISQSEQLPDHIPLSIAWGILWFLLAYAFFTWFFIKAVVVYIEKRRKLMEQDILHAARYLLVKLQSGTPFYTALIDASKKGAPGAVFFREIVQDISTGTPIEVALQTAADLSPSRNFKLVLWQINYALKSGSDVTNPLRYIIDEITSEQFVEIEKYGKKLNSLTLFYMLAAVIVPSLGTAFLTILSGFLGLQIAMVHLYAVAFFLLFLQFMFLSVFRSVRPVVQV